MGLLLLMQLLAVCSVSANDYFGYYNDDFAYKVNHILDEVLQKYKDNVTRNGIVTMKLVAQDDDLIVIGGFALTKATVIKMPQLKRIGDAWFVTKDKELHFKLGLEDNSEMVISGENILGPGWDVNNPTIHVRNFQMTTKQVAKVRCGYDFELMLEKMSSVLLKVGGASYSLDSWINGHINAIGSVLKSPFNRHIKPHIDHCRIMKEKGYFYIDWDHN